MPAEDRGSSLQRAVSGARVNHTCSEILLGFQDVCEDVPEDVCETVNEKSCKTVQEDVCDDAAGKTRLK